jgi:hypothetical protein
MPGSRRSVRHIPIEEPLSFIARQRQNNKAAPTQHPSEEFWRDQSLVWLCHGSGDLEQVASHRVSRSEKTPLRSSHTRRRKQFEKNTAELSGYRYLLRPWSSTAFAVASNALAFWSFSSLRKR